VALAERLWNEALEERRIADELCDSVEKLGSEVEKRVNLQIALFSYQ
jgi:hypothetical protein